MKNEKTKIDLLNIKSIFTDNFIDFNLFLNEVYMMHTTSKEISSSKQSTWKGLKTIMELNDSHKKIKYFREKLFYFKDNFNELEDYCVENIKSKFTMSTDIVSNATRSFILDKLMPFKEDINFKIKKSIDLDESIYSIISNKSMLDLQEYEDRLSIIENKLNKALELKKNDEVRDLNKKIR